MIRPLLLPQEKIDSMSVFEVIDVIFVEHRDIAEIMKGRISMSADEAFFQEKKQTFLSLSEQLQNGGLNEEEKRTMVEEITKENLEYRDQVLKCIALEKKKRRFDHAEKNATAAEQSEACGLIDQF